MQALSALPAADSLFILTSAPRSPQSSTPATMSGLAGRSSARWLQPGAVMRGAGIVRSDTPAVCAVELAPGGGPELADASPGTVVAAHLLAEAAITAPATAIEIGGDPDQVVAELADRTGSGARMALLVIADGAACHGDAAPGRRDDRAGPFDARIVLALEAGDPAALTVACADPALSIALLAGVDPLRVLAGVTAGRPPDEAQVLYSGAPMGVGYVVGSWCWTVGEPA